MIDALLSMELTWFDWTGLHVTGWKLIGYTGRSCSAGAGWCSSWPRSGPAGPSFPRLFWYMSVLGSLMTLSYFIFSPKQDSVGVLQNLFPTFTALYSLYLDIQHRGWKRTRSSTTMGFAMVNDRFCSGRSRWAGCC
jgi:lipid-A-disaccharide synthase-like uncharacterized protein